MRREVCEHNELIENDREECKKQSKSEPASIDLLCGCGREGRYSTKDGISCNKYMRCQTYDELSATLQMANDLLRAYRAKREVDGLNGREWDANAHFEAEAMIKKLER